MAQPREVLGEEVSQRTACERIGISALTPTTCVWVRLSSSPSPRWSRRPLFTLTCSSYCLCRASGWACFLFCSNKCHCSAIPPFQSRTGSTGHSDVTFPMPCTAAMLVSIPNGLHRPFRLGDLILHSLSEGGFNPERAPQAIPTRIFLKCNVKIRLVSIPNGLHRPFRRKTKESYC